MRGVTQGGENFQPPELFEKKKKRIIRREQL